MKLELQIKQLATTIQPSTGVLRADRMAPLFAARELPQAQRGTFHVEDLAAELCVSLSMAPPSVTSDDGPQTPPRQPRASSASGSSAPNLHHDVKPSDLLRQIVEAFGVGVLHRHGLDWTAEEGVGLMAANTEPARSQSTAACACA
jgi:hypothetical protein